MVFRTRSRSRERRRDAFRVVHLESTVNFVGRNVIETLAFVLFREAFPVKLCSLEKGESSHDVRAGKSERVFDGAVHMAFSCEMDDTIDFFILHELVESVKVANVHLHELVVRLAFDILQVCEVARIRELVEVDNIVFRILVDKQANDMASNKACTARDYDCSFCVIHNFFSNGFCLRRPS